MTSTPPSTDETRALARTLVDTLTQGWSKADVVTIMSVFADNAVFSETPFAAPMTGADEIRRYWTDVPYHQSEITTTSGEIYVAGPWFSTEFKTVFRRRRTGDWVEARGAMFCETQDGKISELRMYWHRR